MVLNVHKNHKAHQGRGEGGGGGGGVLEGGRGEEGDYITISCTQLTKRVNKPLRNVTRKQQRRESPIITLTLHATKYDLFALVTIGNKILFLLGDFSFFACFFPRRRHSQSLH